MNLVLAIIPVLLLIILMAFFKMSGDKSSVISLVVTMLIAFFGFHFPVDDLLFSFLYGALKAVSPILIIILMAIFSYNVLLKTEKMEIIKQQFSSISTDKSIQVLVLNAGFCKSHTSNNPKLHSTYEPSLKYMGFSKENFNMM